MTKAAYEALLAKAEKLNACLPAMEWLRKKQRTEKELLKIPHGWYSWAADRGLIDGHFCPDTKRYHKYQMVGGDIRPGSWVCTKFSCGDEATIGCLQCGMGRCHKHIRTAP